MHTHALIAREAAARERVGVAADLDADQVGVDAVPRDVVLVAVLADLHSRDPDALFARMLLSVCPPVTNSQPIVP